jgi:hypothetical protein
MPPALWLILLKYNQKTFSPITLPAHNPSYSIMKLSSGIDVIVESPQIPNYISIILVYKFGVGDETDSGSGYLQWLKNSIMNTLNANEKVLNNTEIEFDKENFTIKMGCMSYQVEEFIETLFNSIHVKTLSKEVLDSMEYDEEQDNDIDLLIQTSAYGFKGKGKPDGGMKSLFKNKEKLFYEGINIHKKNLRPENLLLAVSGVYNLSAFTLIIEDKIKILLSDDPYEPKEKKPDIYIGGRIIVPRNKPKKMIHFDEQDLESEQIAFAFPSVGINHPDFYAITILEGIIGESSYFSTGGPGKGMNALAVKMLHECPPATHVLTLRKMYNSSGLLGLVFKGTKGSSEQLFSSLTMNLRTLHSKISLTDFERARNIVKSKILMGLEGQHARIEEAAANFINYDGEIKINDYLKEIDRVSYKKVIEIVRSTTESKPSIAAIGNFEFLERISNFNFNN